MLLNTTQDMDMIEIAKKATAAAEEIMREGAAGKASYDAVFTAAFVVMANQAKRLRKPIKNSAVDPHAIRRWAESHTGANKTASEIFAGAIGRKPSLSEATQTGILLRSFGIQTKRYGGKNLFLL